jgi:tetratricopeptide (TPR) repeat protein
MLLQGWNFLGVLRPFADFGRVILPPMKNPGRTVVLWEATILGRGGSVSVKIYAFAFCLILFGAGVSSPAVAKMSYEERLAEAERYRIANDLPTALNRYTALVKMRPADARVRAVYGMLLTQTGDLKGGKKEIDNALILNADVPGAHQALAVYYMKTGDKESSRKEYFKTIALEPKRDCHCADLQTYLGVSPAGGKNTLHSVSKNGNSATAGKLSK